MRLMLSGLVLSTPIALLLLLGACVKYQSLDGVENTWRELPADRIQVGTTTQTDILDWLGPPSQIIAIGEQRVFYYLSQKQSGQAKVLIIWNDAVDQTRYDRAVFFFDPEGVLTEYSIRDEASAGH
jgi:outer membrane protein assembly factor BamE (lipoprotein component of BamABCDE complex)